ncbi:MAG TPA: hypothetical protein VHJ76_02530 [Actinomycetota bacterium]|nr:hypothetical protein [Actinomycetota bacterium]
MKSLILTAVAAAALALPAGSAAASEIPPYAGTKSCPAPYTGGYIVWHDTPVTAYDEIWLCIPGGPGAATAGSYDSARAGVSKCTGGGYKGYYVWYYDLDNSYHVLLNACIYTGP